MSNIPLARGHLHVLLDMLDNSSVLVGPREVREQIFLALSLMGREPPMQKGHREKLFQHYQMAHKIRQYHWNMRERHIKYDSRLETFDEIAAAFRVNLSFVSQVLNGKIYPESFDGEAYL